MGSPREVKKALRKWKDELTREEKENLKYALQWKANYKNNRARELYYETEENIEIR